VAHSLKEFSSALIGGAVAVEIWREHSLEKACKKVKGEAQRVIGTYDYGWPQLAESTQEERKRLGFPPNEPLLRTGEMRDSIEYTVDRVELEGYVGSNDPIAVHQELGTSRIPPRSFLGGAARAKEDEIHEEISKGLHLTLMGALGLAATGARLPAAVASTAVATSKYAKEFEAIERHVRIAEAARHVSLTLDPETFFGIKPPLR
jgi:hypothetical protein